MPLCFFSNQLVRPLGGITLMRQIRLVLITIFSFLASVFCMDIEQCDIHSREISKNEITERLKAIYTKSPLRKLPYKLSHNNSKYLRPPFNQVGGSCGSASRIAYYFAYEINNYRDLDGSLPENTYPTHFTWLLTKQNSSKHDILKFNGCPNSIDYEGDTYSKVFSKSVPDKSDDNYGWMQGYDRWKNALFNKISYSEKFRIETPEALQLLKEWLYDHQGDSSFNAGGISAGGAAMSGMSFGLIPKGQYGEGSYIVKAYGKSIDHAVTWIGYDDSIGWDYNNDGKLTNNIDINNDGVINMADWERGSLIMRNSWGKTWKNKGNVYIPYKVIFERRQFSEYLYIKKDYKPLYVLKVKMKYSSRCDLKLTVGINQDTSSNTPTTKLDAHHFIFAGNGKVPMLGKWEDGKLHDEPMIFALDLTDLLDSIDEESPFNFFLGVETSEESKGVGEIVSCDVIKYNNYSSTYPYSYDSTIIKGEQKNIELKGSSLNEFYPLKIPLKAVKTISMNTVSHKSYIDKNTLYFSNQPLPQQVLIYSLQGKLHATINTSNKDNKRQSISLENYIQAKGVYIIINQWQNKKQALKYQNL